MSAGSPPFECRRCGHCCQGQGGIILTEKDIVRLVARLELDRDEFIDTATETKAGRIRLRTGPDDYCIFYRHDLKGCGVHQARPDICRAWPFFRGNLIDPTSWAMIQEYCPGVNSAVRHEDFVRHGRAYLRECGLVNDEDDAPSALRPA